MERTCWAWVGRQQISLAGAEDGIRDLIGRNRLLLTAQQMRVLLGENNFRQFLHEVFRDPGLKPGATHLLLPEMGFAAILTTNYDQPIEKVSLPERPGRRATTIPLSSSFWWI